MRTTAAPKGTVAQLLVSTAMHALLTLSIGASQIQSRPANVAGKGSEGVESIGSSQSGGTTTGHDYNKRLYQIGLMLPCGATVVPHAGAQLPISDLRHRLIPGEWAHDTCIGAKQLRKATPVTDLVAGS